MLGFEKKLVPRPVHDTPSLRHSFMGALSGQKGTGKCLVLVVKPKNAKELVAIDAGCFSYGQRWAWRYYAWTYLPCRAQKELLCASLWYFICYEGPGVSSYAAATGKPFVR